MLYLAYLDEFGHVGPFVNRTDARYNQSPVFGLAGIILPSTKVRDFATWFFQQKEYLLGSEIARSGIHPAKWEKKGAELYTTGAINKYRSIRGTTSRILHKVNDMGGGIFFIGNRKQFPPGKHNSEYLYRGTLKTAINQLDRFCRHKNATFAIVMDESDDGLRQSIVESAALTMFGKAYCQRLIEPPLQAESHLFQTVQCADWICGLIGRYGANLAEPKQYADFAWVEKYFGYRIRQAAISSNIRI